MLRFIFDMLRSDWLRLSIGLTMLRFGGIALAFGLQVLIIKLAGPTLYGAYATGLSIILVLSIVSQVGTSWGAIRFLPVYENEKQPLLYTGYLRFLFSVQLTMAVSITILLEAGLAVLHGNSPSMFTLGFQLMFLAVPSLTMLVTGYEIGSCFGRTNFAFAMYQVAQPLCLVLVIGLVCWVSRAPPTFTAISIGYVAISLTSALVTWAIMLNRQIPELFRSSHSAYDVRSWFGVCLRQYGTGLLDSLDNHVLTLYGATAVSLEVVGAAALFQRLASIPDVFVFAAGSALFPKFSKIMALRDHKALVRNYSQIVVASMAICIIVFLIFLEIASYLLPALSSSYAGMELALLIFVAGSALRLSLGPIRHLLVIGPLERYSILPLLVSVVTKASIGFALVGPLGIYGIAWAFFGGNIARMLVELLLVRELFKTSTP